MDDSLKTVRQVSIFATLPESDQLAIARLARKVRLAARQTVVREGQPGEALFAIVKGKVKVVGFTILGPGDIFGELSVLDGARRSATIVTLEPVEFLVLDRAPLLAFLRSTPEVAIMLLQTLSGRIRRLSDEREEATRLDTSARLAKRLVDLAARFGVPSETEGSELRIDVKLSQQDLGALVDTTRESVNRILAQRTREGVLRVSDGYVFVRDLPALTRLSMARASDPPPPTKGDE